MRAEVEWGPEYFLLYQFLISLLLSVEYGMRRSQHSVSLKFIMGSFGDSLSFPYGYVPGKGVFEFGFTILWEGDCNPEGRGWAHVPLPRGLCFLVWVAPPGCKES